jgi:NAD+ synthase (glutamine-hydrolysing)
MTQIGNTGLRIRLAQLNFKIGDFEGNTAKMAQSLFEAKTEGIDLVVFSELATSGYCPDDLLDYAHFVERCEQALDAVAQCCFGIAAIVGSVQINPEPHGRRLINTAAFLAHGRIQESVSKTLLPSYDVFSEHRYFEPAQDTKIVEYKGVKLGLAICEDLWDIYNDFQYRVSPGQRLKDLGAEIIINPSASPFQLGKQSLRNRVFAGQLNRFGLPVLYVNQVGFHTELLFDGASRAVGHGGQVLVQLPCFEEATADVQLNFGLLTTESQLGLPLETDDIPLLHRALVFALQDYFSKMGFQKATLGASGGIDSAVVQCLAVEALGAENVSVLLMPSEYSSDHSVTDAVALSENLGNAYTKLNIAPIYNSLLQQLEPVFGDSPFGLAEENLQARTRGVLLMATSNKTGAILLNTSNKSELAVGYSTLYGDLCGSLSVLGDVYKQQVYALAQYINREKEIIPNHIITKAPSAELRPGQKDSDSLPDYSILDEIIRKYIEDQQGAQEIIADGYDPNTVNKVLQLINGAEYKRYQAPPIVRVSKKSFGKGRRMPLVAQY